MNRLTQRVREHIVLEDTNMANEKIAMIEDIEEELGCPIDVVFKALRQGSIYFVKEKINVRYLDCFEVFDRNEDGTKIYNGKFVYCLTCTDKENNFCGVFLDEYCDMWWLREDKSE